ncbi:MAG TPA: sodium:solute symporter [Pirellulaceae bacterium]
MTIHLGWIDIAVLLMYLTSAVVVGLVVSGRGKNLETYLLGDRDLPWWAILGSIVATETSTATVISVPGKAFGPDGMRFLQLAMGYCIGRVIIVRVLLPLYFQGQLFTAYQVLERRFGGLTKRAASLLFLVTRNLSDALRLFLTAIVLQRLGGLDFVSSVIAMGLVTIFYTFFGGMRSVVWNDCIQFVVYVLGGVAAVFVIASQVPGGWNEILQYGSENERFQIFDFRPLLSYPFTFWAGLIGGAVLTIGTHGTDHMMVQRYLSARSQNDAGRAIVLSGFVVLIQFALFLFIGAELAAFYARHPEILESWKQLAAEKRWTTDDVFPHFIVNFFPANTGLIGLILAAILAAAMSTLSSSLNSSASALVNDFYVSARKTEASSEHLFFLTRWLTVAFGIIQIGIAIWARQLEKAVVDNALTIAGFSAGLLLGVFSLGVLTKRAGQASALIGGAVGLAVLLWLQFIAPRSDIRIAWPWFALIGATATYATGCVVALFAPRQGTVA